MGLRARRRQKIRALNGPRRIYDVVMIQEARLSPEDLLAFSAWARIMGYLVFVGTKPPRYSAEGTTNKAGPPKEAEGEKKRETEGMVERKGELGGASSTLGTGWGADGKKTAGLTERSNGTVQPGDPGMSVNYVQSGKSNNIDPQGVGGGIEMDGRWVSEGLRHGYPQCCVRGFAEMQRRAGKPAWTTAQREANRRMGEVDAAFACVPCETCAELVNRGQIALVARKYDWAAREAASESDVQQGGRSAHHVMDGVYESIGWGSIVAASTQRPRGGGRSKKCGNAGGGRRRGQVGRRHGNLQWARFGVGTLRTGHSQHYWVARGRPVVRDGDELMLEEQKEVKAPGGTEFHRVSGPELAPPPQGSPLWDEEGEDDDLDRFLGEEAAGGTTI